MERMILGTAMISLAVWMYASDKAAKDVAERLERLEAVIEGTCK